MVREMKNAVSAGVMTTQKLAEEVRLTVAAAATVGEKLAEIITQVTALTPRFDEVRESMDGQSLGAEQIALAMTQLGETTRQTSATIRDTNGAVQALTIAAHDLHTEFSRFRV
jgi:methyl-accepting chemotaxis protein WspA